MIRPACTQATGWPITKATMLRKTNAVRAQYAKLINASPDEIGFLFATSEGENVVARSMHLGRGDNVVIDELHYETEFVLYSHLAKTTGVELRVAKAKGGAVTTKELEPLVNRRTKLVSVAWVSHQNGFRHDMRPIADLAHAVGTRRDALPNRRVGPTEETTAQQTARDVGAKLLVAGGALGRKRNRIHRRLAQILRGCARA